MSDNIRKRTDKLGTIFTSNVRHREQRATSQPGWRCRYCGTKILHEISEELHYAHSPDCKKEAIKEGEAFEPRTRMEILRQMRTK